MNAPDPPPVEDAGLHDQQMLDAVEAYRARRARGERVDPCEFAQAYPAIAEALTRCLQSLSLLDRAAEELRDEGDPLDAQGGSEAQPRRFGDYHIIREIGRGGMGVVYEAEQISLARRVALKVLPFSGLLDPRQLARFKIEAQAAAHLHHTNIVPVFAVGCERGVNFYAMQYIDGETLSTVLQELRLAEGIEATPAESVPALSQITVGLASNEWAEQNVAPPEPATSHTTVVNPSSGATRSRPYFQSVARLGIQAAEALEHAHSQGVIHRDIKPSNMLLDERGNLWITDFGLATFVSDKDNALTLPGDLVGTARYMSPEQALAQRIAIDHRTDVYSLGVTLYELLTLRPAFDGPSRNEILRRISEYQPIAIRKLNPKVPVDLETIVLKAMSREPQERYPKAQQLADDLRRFIQDEPIRARRPTVSQRVSKWCRRHRAAVWAAAAMVLMSLAGLSMTTVLLWQEQRQTAAALSEAETAYAEAKTRRQEADVHRNAAETERTQAQRMLAVSQIERGTQKLNQGDGLGLFDLADAMATAEAIPEIRATAARLWSVAHVPWKDRLAGVLPPSFTFIFSPDSRVAVTAGGNAAQMWDLQTWRTHGPAMTMDEDIHGFAFRPDGTLIAVLDVKGEARLFHTADASLHGEPLKTDAPLDVRLNESPPVFSPDGKLLASAYGSKGARLWDVETCKPYGPYLESEGPCPRVRFSPDGRYLLGGAVVSGQGTAWDLSNFSVLHSQPQWMFPFISPDGSRVIQAGFADVVRRVSQWPSLQQLYLIPSESSTLSSTQLSQRNWLAVGWGEPFATLHSPDGEKSNRLPHEQRVRWVYFSPDGDLLSTVTTGRLLRLWGVDTRRRVFGPTPASGYVATFSHDGLMIASGQGSIPNGPAVARDPTRIWYVQPRSNVRTLPHHSAVEAFRFSPDGNWIATASTMCLQSWDVGTGLPRGPAVDEWGTPFALAFTPDGECLLAGKFTRIQSWDTRQWTRRRGVLPTVPLTVDNRLPFGLPTVIDPLLVHPDGRHVLVTRMRLGEPGHSVTWDMHTGMPVDKTFDREATTWAFSPDGRLRASGSTTPFVSLWELSAYPTSEPVRLNVGESCYGISFRHDSRRLATASWGCVAKIWDTSDPRNPVLVDELPHDEPVWTVDYSVDGSWLATSSGYGRPDTVWLWDLSGPAPHHGIKLPPELARGRAMFSPNGRTLGSSYGIDGVVRLWDLPEIPSSVERVNLASTLAMGGSRQGSAFEPFAMDQWQAQQERFAKLEGTPPATATAAEPWIATHLKALDLLHRASQETEASKKLPLIQACVDMLERLAVERPETQVHRGAAARARREYARELSAAGEKQRAAEEILRADETLLDLIAGRPHGTGRTEALYDQWYWGTSIGIARSLNDAAAMRKWYALVARTAHRLTPDVPSFANDAFAGAIRGGEPTVVADFTDAMLGGRPKLPNWAMFAAACLEAEDYERYVKVCKLALVRSAGESDPNQLYVKVWISCLSPEAVERLGPGELLAAARYVAERDASSHAEVTLGGILLRAGHLEEAEHTLLSAVARPEEDFDLLSKTYAWFFLAMAQQQLGREAEAQQALAEGIRKAEEELKKPVSLAREFALIRLRKEAELIVGRP